MWNGTDLEFEQILNEYRPALYGTAFTYLSGTSEIDDVIQETFIEFYCKYDTIRDKSKVGAWLCGVCRNIALKRLRSSRFTLSLECASGKASADPADIYEKADRRRAVHAAISRLSRPVAETVSLYYITGLSVAAIAELLSVPQGTVKSRLYEGRRRLKGELEFMMESEIRSERTAGTPELNEKIRSIVREAEAAMKRADQNAAVLMLDRAIAEIGENTEHYRTLAGLYRKRGEAEFMNDRKKSNENEARALEYAKLTGDEVLIASYMLLNAYNAEAGDEAAAKMHETYEYAARIGHNGICAEAICWEGLNHIHLANLPAARHCLESALEYYGKLGSADMIDICDGNIRRVRAFAGGALRALELLREAGREPGDWESCGTFCQILRRDGESVTAHNNYGWGIPGRQFRCCGVFGLFEGQGYLFAEELLEKDSVEFEYYNFANLAVKQIYTVESRDAEIDTPAGHFTGCMKIVVREELTCADEEDPANRESRDYLCDYVFVICPGIGLVSHSCTYTRSPELNRDYGRTTLLARYVIAEPSRHVLPLEEGNEFEYFAYDASGTPVSEHLNYRDIYRVDSVYPDGMICLANYGYSYFG